MSWSIPLFACEIYGGPTQILYDTQVIAMMPDPGPSRSALEVSDGRSEYAATGMILCSRHVYVP
jgi:hypothetical protein